MAVRGALRRLRLDQVELRPSKFGSAFGSIKLFFHFNRIVARRIIFHRFGNAQAELMTWTQENTPRFATIQLKWEMGLI